MQKGLSENYIDYNIKIIIVFSREYIKKKINNNNNS